MGMTFEASIKYVDPRDELIWWNGRKYFKKELCDMYNIPIQNFYDRKHKGWSLERILNTPVKTVHKI